MQKALQRSRLAAAPSRSVTLPFKLGSLPCIPCLQIAHWQFSCQLHGPLQAASNLCCQAGRAYAGLQGEPRAYERCSAQVDILITACTSLAMLPSMSALVANHFKMREDLQSYSLGGQGCTSGVLAVELARHLLKVLLHPGLQYHGCMQP